MDKYKNSIIDFFGERSFVLSIYLLASMYTISFSGFASFQVVNILLMGIRVIAYSLVAIKFFIDLFNKKCKAYLIEIVLFGIFMMFISYKSKTINYFVYFVLIVVGKDVKYIDIIKAAFYGIFSCTAFVIIMSLFGIIDDSISSLGFRNRHSLGFDFPACGANYIFYSILYYIYVRKDKMKWFEILVAFAINLIIFILTDTKSAFMYGTLALLITLVINYNSKFRIYKRIYTFIMYLASIVLPLFAVIITYLYNENNKIFVRLNGLLTGRLRLGKTALNEYGVKLFGQYVKISIGEDPNLPYNVIDSSYVQYLIILGLVFFIIMIVFFLCFSNQIGEKKDIYLFYIFTILLCHATFDKIILQLSNNYFMFLWSYKNTVANNE